MEDMLIFIFNILSDILAHKRYGKLYAFLFPVPILSRKRGYYEGKILDRSVFFILMATFLVHRYFLASNILDFDGQNR